MFEYRENYDVFISNSTNMENHSMKTLLRDSVRQALKNYFFQLNAQNVTKLYSLVLAEVEQPLLEMVMEYTEGNQTLAANMMGINRGTLRKKLKKYAMDQ
ncbi:MULTISPECIES: DNA-binding transcriptional regulator Fis [Candidatus Hamiltonella]|uniref:Putative Fis-like DNA-binding protein n=2 Tax=Candidatus Williamhamiltonella defendens TaxID=138072 RepID=C4K3I1_HAMD5|nr:DNA-binding transcriptional regulator Fis [Candidatus Hamiltonella defensa]ACQ67124.1 DNA-binding protein for site-specific recombination and inversion, transcription of rRNA and tRNA operons, and DNA replication [Candidatus Hamiltonella defensa 5AT (Acyrthosiphon pisum)]ATW21902.1 Fis family transcriptional regulator [Candidatus Hamiltonella defensa]ATW33185.1 Fis family transcriptional regulator [Candidatus Hamiltonella defensa]AYB49206.1 DNA-binding transcriptional regulator Fis [Candidat